MSPARGLSRRDLVRYGTAWAIAGLVVGCSGNDDGEEDRGGPGPSTTGGDEPGGGGTVTLRDVRIFDGDEVLDADTVVVEGGLITAVGRALEAPSGSEVHDDQGGLLMPGLIDAHGHTSLDDQLVDCLRFGVTTVLDMFSRIGADPVGADLRAQRTELARTDQADFWSAGILVTAPGGHGTQFGEIPVLAPGDDADAVVAERVGEGSDFVKIVIENGSQTGRGIPTLSAEQVAAVVTAAHDRDLLAIVHVSTWAAAEIAAAAGADLLAHVPSDPRPSDEALQKVVDSGIAVVATLAVQGGVSCTDDAARLRDDPAIADDLSTAQRNDLALTFPTCFHGRRSSFWPGPASIRSTPCGPQPPCQPAPSGSTTGAGSLRACTATCCWCAGTQRPTSSPCGSSPQSGRTVSPSTALFRR